jgi:hypothetical protein
MAKPRKPKRPAPPPGKKLIFRPYITDKKGRVIFAAQCGIRAFPIWVDV